MRELRLIEVEEFPFIVVKVCSMDGGWGIKKIKETFGNYGYQV